MRQNVQCTNISKQQKVVYFTNLCEKQCIVISILQWALWYALDSLTDLPWKYPVQFKYELFYSTAGKRVLKSNKQIFHKYPKINEMAAPAYAFSGLTATWSSPNKEKNLNCKKVASIKKRRNRIKLLSITLSIIIVFELDSFADDVFARR